MTMQVLSCADSSHVKQFIGAGFPIIPVALHRVKSKWKKQPLVGWDQASASKEVIEGWWRCWPDAVPAIPLRMTNLVVVDADIPEAVEEMKALRMLGPHSKIATRGGGLHMVFAQPPEPITKFVWSPGVEVLGTSCLLTCYDLEALRFPYVAPRAILPKMFWKPRVGQKREPINKERPECAAVARDVASLTDALFALDPVDWRGEHDRWLSLMNAAKWLGIAEDDFVHWSLGDPVYAADEKVIRRKWGSLTPTHGGALYAALSEAGIKIAANAAKRPLIDGHPLSANLRQPTRNWRSRVNTVIDVLWAKQDPDCLFWAGCRMAEVMIDTKKPTLKVARALLEGACPRLRREIGPSEVSRIITNAFHHIEKEELR